MEQLTRNAAAAHQVEAELIEQTREDIRAGKIRDAAGAARNMATVAGIAVDKVGDITGRPAVVEIKKSSDELWAEFSDCTLAFR